MRLDRRSFVALGAGLLIAPRALAQGDPGAKPVAKAPAPAQKPAAFAAPPPLAVRGAKLVRPGQPPLENATIAIANGKIGAIGAGAAAAANATTIDAAGKVVTAGFTDLITGIGLVEVDLEASARHDSLYKDDPIRAAFLAADGYDPASDTISVTRLGGITSAGVVPRGGFVAGQSAWVDLDGQRASDAIVSKRLALHVLIDDGAIATPGESVGTSLLRLRELFDDARAFKRNPGAFDRNQLRKLTASRLDLSAVSDALDGKLRVVFHVDRAADIVSVLELARENKLKAVIASAAEGWKVASDLAAAKITVIVYALDHLPRTFAARGAREDNAALLHAAGVPVAITSGETHRARRLRQIAGNAVRAGLPYDAALDAVTRIPARAFGLEARYGSVEPGRVANLVVWSGDPFELSTRVEAVIVRGRQLPLTSRQTALFERYKPKKR